jgi:hypothetical protein
MRTFADMHARHAFGLEALAEMTGKLLQGAYQRASFPADPEDQDRAILLFDRLSRGFRLTIALEARLERDRRREAAEAAPRERPLRPAADSRPPRPPQEEDCERELDLEAADLSDAIGDLRRMVAEDADILDPDGDHAPVLDRLAGAWGDVIVARTRPEGDPPVPGHRAAAPLSPPAVRPHRRASG